VKLNTSKLVDLARALVPSAQQAGNDSQLQVPNQVLCVTEIPGQLFSSSSPPATAILSESFEWVNQINVGGAAGQQSILGPSLAPGLWRLTGHLWAGFTGTNNIAQEFTLSMFPAVGGSVYLGRAGGFAQAAQQRFDLLISTKDQMQLRISTAAATVAGDLLQLLALVHASRVL